MSGKGWPGVSFSCWDQPSWNIFFPAWFVDLHCLEKGMLLSKGSWDKTGHSPTLAWTPPTPRPDFRALGLVSFSPGFLPPALASRVELRIQVP